MQQEKLCPFAKAGTVGGVCAADECSAMIDGKCGLPPHIVSILCPELDVTDTDSLENRISDVLLRCGVRPGLAGYKYLISGIRMGAQNPEALARVTDILYPAIAEEFGVNTSQVERAVRYAIQYAFRDGSREYLQNMFPCLSEGKESVSNSWFISAVTDRIVRGRV